MIMQKHQNELLKDGSRSFSSTSTKFLPCLLMDVKYVQESKNTQEAKMIWNLENGELLLDTQNCESTHGFEDCIKAKATDDDFRILHVLQRHGGTLARDEICHELGLDTDVAYERLESLRKKHLIAIRGEVVRIHLQSPLFKTQPHTHIAHSLVLQNAPKENIISSLYSKEQIKKVAQACFGSDFAIRSDKLIFMPIFQIEIQNSDGSIQKTYWNGLTGKRMELQNLL